MASVSVVTACLYVVAISNPPLHVREGPPRLALLPLEKSGVPPIAWRHARKELRTGPVGPRPGRGGGQWEENGRGCAGSAGPLTPAKWERGRRGFAFSAKTEIRRSARRESFVIDAGGIALS